MTRASLRRVHADPFQPQPSWLGFEGPRVTLCQECRQRVIVRDREPGLAPEASSFPRGVAPPPAPTPHKSLPQREKSPAHTGARSPQPQTCPQEELPGACGSVVKAEPSILCPCCIPWGGLEEGCTSLGAPGATVSRGGPQREMPCELVNGRTRHRSYSWKA